MARMKLLALYLIALIVVGSPYAVAEVLPPEIPDPEAVQAFKQYGHAFDEYETKLLKRGETRFNQAWEDVRKAYRKEKAKLNSEQIQILEGAAAKYRKHLENHPSADNRPYVLLNLAQILNLIGDHLMIEDQSGGRSAKNEAIAMLVDIETNYKTFSHREQALYQRAVILESLDSKEDAFLVWQSLASAARTTVYGVHARVAVGDYYFAKDRAGDAMVAYEKALELLGSVEVENPEYETLRINYRLAWSAYRAAELDTAIKASVAMLKPGRNAPNEDQARKMVQDAVDLVGDALYENNTLKRSKDLLMDKELAPFAAAIGLRTLQRYNANSIHGEAVQIGEFLADNFPLTKEAPMILQITADSYEKLGKTPKRMTVLEKLALLLPAQSLWRSRYQEDLNAIRDMEERAQNAAVVVASSYYETGLASGNSKAYEAAAAFYESLIKFSPNSDKSNEWRVKQAHCHYFTGDYTEAARLYTELKTGFKVDPETLQVASYQLVLTSERQWRDQFGKTVEKGIDPYTDEQVTKSLSALEKSAEEFASRFPGQGRSVDLLLVAASANRDMNRFEPAAKYWQRVLLSQPNASQRGVAIRGMLFAAMKNGSTGDVVTMASRFLKLEDWSNLGLNLGVELRGVLSSAALDESKRLSNDGKVLEAGLLLSQIAQDFPAIPDRDRIFRDGAYLLAIGGDWVNAQKAAQAYLQAGLNKNRDDMTYLLGRAQEYQLRLHDAAKTYFDLGERFPTHPRADASLERSEKLASAEGDYALAAQAASLLAQRSKDSGARLAAQGRAIDYLEKGEDPNKALDVARKRLSNATTDGERMRARVLIARLTYKAGNEQQALDELAVMAKQIDRLRGRIPQDQHAALTGEVNFLLAEEAKRKFDDFRIQERAGNLNDNITVKSRYFEDLVASYDKAAAAGDPKWAARSRYQLAVAADAFADEIAAVPNKSDENLTLKARNRYSATVERLQGMARRYYSANILAARKDPTRLKQDEWVKKSAMRLDGDKSESEEMRRKDLLPPAAQDSLPSQWSL